MPRRLRSISRPRARPIRRRSSSSSTASYHFAKTDLVAIISNIFNVIFHLILHILQSTFFFLSFLVSALDTVFLLLFVLVIYAVVQKHTQQEVDKWKIGDWNLFENFRNTYNHTKTTRDWRGNTYTTTTTATSPSSQPWGPFSAGRLKRVFARWVEDMMVKYLNAEGTD